MCNTQAIHSCMGTGLLRRAATQRCPLLVQQRTFSWTIAHRSGHNRWSKIRHDKAKDDAAKSKERTGLSEEVILASKHGGPDPALNSRLALAIAKAKRGQLSKSSIESAILKGQGKSISGVPLENVTIEAMLPFGVAAIVECQTEQKLRVLQDVRHIITKMGGTITPASFMFNRKGKIWFEYKEGMGVNEAMDEAVEAGAEDIYAEDNRLVVDTLPNDVTAVAQKLRERLHLQIHKTEILLEPKSDMLVYLDDEQGAELQRILDAIDEEQSVQNVYINGVPRS